MPFINVENKVDSAEKLAAAVGKPTNNYLFAAELNEIVSKINELGDANQKWEVRGSNFTAEAGGNYIVVAALTITEPITGVTGQSFRFFVMQGASAVYKGTTYLSSEFVFSRHTTSWSTGNIVKDRRISGGTAVNGGLAANNTNQIQIRRDTAANWTSANTILALAELGYEFDTNRIKVGDGTTAWNSLGYFASGVTDGDKTDIVVSGSGAIWTIATALKSAWYGAVAWISTNGAALIAHISNTGNPHNTTKAQVGLSNVDNTSDTSKPVSSAQLAALNLKENTSNKATNLASPDNTKYPTTLAVSTAVDSLQGQIDALDLNIGDILTRELIENGIAWFLPALNGITNDARNSSRVNTNPVYFGTVSIGALQFSITAHSITGPGQVSGVRAHSGFSISSRNGVDTIRDFYPPALPASSDTRYTVGWSQQFNAADPTNTDQLTHINCMYVCKLATSDNLHIVHNDDTGTATSIDLGADFPANSALYKYRFFVRKITNSSYLVQVIRTTLSNGAILVSSPYSITANLPTAASDLNQIFYIASNTQTGTFFFGDYGLILKRTPL